MSEYDEKLRSRIYWAVYNGFEIRIGEFFFWLNFQGIGIGRVDNEGLGRGQWVRYFHRSDREEYRDP